MGKTVQQQESIKYITKKYSHLEPSITEQEDDIVLEFLNDTTKMTFYIGSTSIVIIRLSDTEDYTRELKYTIRKNIEIAIDYEFMKFLQK